MKKFIAVIFGVTFPFTALAYACCGDDFTKQHLLAYVVALLGSSILSYYIFKKFFPGKSGSGKMQFAIVNIFSDLFYLSSVTLGSSLTVLLFHPLFIYAILRYFIGSFFWGHYYFSYSDVDHYDFYPNHGLKVDENLVGLLFKPEFLLIIFAAIFIKFFLFLIWFRLIKKEEMSFLKLAGFVTISVLIFFLVFLIIWNLGFLVFPPGRAFQV